MDAHAHYNDTPIHTCIHTAVKYTHNIACNFKMNAHILWTFVAQTQLHLYVHVCAELLNTHKQLTGPMNGNMHGTCCKVWFSMNTRVYSI